jgi:hypothetical protein
MFPCAEISILAAYPFFERNIFNISRTVSKDLLLFQVVVD